MKIEFDSTRCRQCHSCEIACSFHLYGSYAPSQAAIQILEPLLIEEDPIFSFLSEKCDMCVDVEKAQCVKYCPFGALRQVNVNE